MKRVIAALLTAIMLVPIFSIPALAASADTVEQTIKALGIMVGDEKGNMNLGAYVTRAQFSKMLTAASVYKDTVGEQARISPFRDVKYTHWAAEYVKTSVDAGWVVGYTDGTFRPDNTIKLEEAASSVLRLLGYSAADLTGTYPAAQVSKFRALGLADGINPAQGQLLTRKECMYIFYNLMGASTKEGKAYAALLGYTVNASGEIDYASVMKATRKGPFVVQDENWSNGLPFSIGGATLYRDDKPVEAASISRFDVIYYNENMKTVWAYSDKVTGVYTLASPSDGYPDTVTVAGGSYKIATATASMKLSATGTFGIGDTVTLLLGMDKTVVDVIDAAEISDIKYGIVIATGTGSYTDSDGKTVSQNTVKVACTDGVEREYLVGVNTYDKGSIVSAGYSGGKFSVKWLARSSISGKVNSIASMIGERYIADGAEILDINSEGGYLKISAPRIAGTSLVSENVLFYVLDAEGKIDKLILNDVTGDLATYGILVKSEKTATGSSVMGSYEMLINGNRTMGSTNGPFLNASVGPSMFEYKNGSLSRITSLSNALVSSVTELSVISGSKTYRLADGVQVYEKTDEGAYVKTSLSSVSDLSKYQLVAWYDNSSRPAGGRVRVITATEK